MIATNSVRRLSKWEQEIVSRLDPSAAYKRMEDLLCSFYFQEEQGRALILQSKRHYAVFFLSLPFFNDADKKKQELEKFFELVAFIRWLKEQGYITLYRGTIANEKVMHFLQDNFQHAQASGETIYLNAKGDYTAVPDTIHDKGQNIVYKGIIFDGDTYEMIAGAVTGNLYISKSISQLLTPAGIETAIPETPDAAPGKPLDPKPDINPAEATPAIHDHPIAKSEEQSNNTVMTTTNIVKRPSGRSNAALILSLVLLVVNIAMFFFFFDYLHKLRNKVNAVSRSYLIAIKKVEDLRSEMTAGKLDSGSRTLPDTATYYYGIDISHWNGNIMEDISQIDSLTFAICKATEGVSGIDQAYQTNSSLIAKRGLIRGKYHFYLVNDDPIAQAEHFYKTTGPAGPQDMPLIIDIEETSLSKRGTKGKLQIQNELLSCLAHLEKLSGRIPIIYTDLAFANEYLNNTQFAKYALWLAEYTTARQPRIPNTWKQTGYKIWQKSERLDINSFTVDYDVYYGTKQKLYLN